MDYEVNVKTVLATQSAGIGQSGMTRVAALLSLTDQRSLFGNVWRDLEERIAIQEKILCKVVVANNLEEELEATRQAMKEKGENVPDKPPIKMALDMGWNKKGSGRSYNADSGQHFGIGMMLRKVISLV